MKRLISFIYALLVLVSMCAIFTSCDAVNQYLPDSLKQMICQHSYDDGEITTAPTRENDGVKTFTCTLCGATRTESVEYRTTITKEEWVANMNEDNYTVTLTSESMPSDCAMCAKVCETAFYQCYIYSGVPSNEAFVALVDGVWYFIQIINENTKNIYQTIKPDKPLGSVCALGDVEDWSAAYDLLVYDEEKDAYVYTAGEEDCEPRYVYFENGVITKVEMYVSGGEYSAFILQTYTVTDIGTTVVDNVPDISVE